MDSIRVVNELEVRLIREVGRTEIPLARTERYNGRVTLGEDRGTKEHVMREAKALGVEHRIHTPGFVERSRLTSLYQHADALLYPSLFGPDNPQFGTTDLASDLELTLPVTGEYLLVLSGTNTAKPVGYKFRVLSG